MTAGFELIEAGAISGDALRQITEFLDSQDTAHPFQFPQWLGLNVPGTPRGVYFALFWAEGKLVWFARCGRVYPAGTAMSLLRSLAITRGPVCDDLDIWSSVLDALVEQATAAGFAYAEIAPECIAPGTGLAKILHRESWTAGSEDRVSLRLDISMSEDILMGGFRKTTRHEVQKAERIGLQVETSHDEPTISRFLKMHDEMGERKGFAAEAPEHLRNVISWLAVEPERGSLLLAHHNGELVGRVVIVRAGKRCWYVWGATTRREGFSVGHLLQWRAILWAKAHGCTQYDFGGYREGATSGPALFKQGFGGSVVHFVPSYRKVLRSSTFWVMKKAAMLRR